MSAAKPERKPRPSLVRPTLSPSGVPAAIFICVKSADTRAALAQARRLAGLSTPIVSLQNGLAHVASSRKAAGAGRAVFGACYAAIGREGPAGFRHHAGDTVWLGSTPQNRDAVAEARRWLMAAGLNAPVPAREDRVLWTKLVFNAAANPVGALAARPNGDLAKDPALWEVLERALSEGVAVARAAGHSPLMRDMAGFVRKACLATPRQENSMLQDLRQGRATEVEAIIGPLLSAGRRHAKAVPVLRALRGFVVRLERELGRP